MTLTFDQGAPRSLTQPAVASRHIRFAAIVPVFLKMFISTEWD
jgi:hypothetical protein